MLAHYAAVKSRLEADATLKVFPAARTDQSGKLLREQYVILFGGPPDELNDDRLTAPQTLNSDAEFLFPTRAVSVTADGAMLVAAKVMTQLVNFRPSVDGRNCRMWLDTADGVEPDNEATPPLYYVDATYVLRSTRA